MDNNSLNINAIDSVEVVATKLGMRFYRPGDNEISLLLASEKSEYQLLIELRQDVYEALYFSCDINIDVPKENYQAAAIAVVKANEHSWLGHFDLISTDCQIMYSLTIHFASAFNFDELNTESILNIILDECDRFRQYFTIAMDDKGGMSDLSINTLFFEALGEA